MKAVEPGAMAVRPMSEGRTARLPAHVLVLPAPQQIGWLDSSEACTLFKRKTRHGLRPTFWNIAKPQRFHVSAVHGSVSVYEIEAL